MKFLRTRLQALLLCACMVLPLAACAAQGTAPRTDVPLGRYAETEIPLPEEAEAVLSAVPLSGGALQLYAIEGKSIIPYRYADGTFERQSAAWLDALNAGEDQFESLAAAPDGTLYILTTRPKGDDCTANLWRVEQDQLVEVPVEWPDGLSYVNRLAVLSDGSFLIGLAPGNLHHYNADGSLRAAHERYNDGFGETGGKLAVAYPDEQAFRLYDLATGEETGSALPFASPEKEGYSGGEFAVASAPAGDGALYYADRSGLYRLSPDEDTFERLIDGGLCSMGSASLGVQYLLPGENGLFHIVYYNSDGGSMRLMEYRYDPTLPTEPEKKLNILSLYDVPLAREAANVFQKANPDVQVQFTTLIGTSGADSGITVSDAVKTINTELLAGRGADLYILDDLPIDSYVAKGVLADLSDLAGPRIASGEWLPGVASTFEREGKLPALPALFGLPVMWGSADFLAGVHDLTTLADWAQAHPEKPLFYSMHPRNLIERLYPVCAPAWRDGTGAIQTAAFTEFLEQVGRIAGTVQPMPDYTEAGSGLDGAFEVPGFYQGSNQILAHEILQTEMLPTDLAAIEKRGGGGMTSLTGQAQNVFTPRSIVGINQNAQQPELARAFLETLFTPAVQQTSFSSYQGLPVNRTALGEVTKDRPNYMCTFGYGMPDEVSEDGLVIIPIDSWIGEAEQKQFLALCESADTPSVRDPVLLDMILEETEAFFTGGISAAQAADAVIQRTQAYLAE